MGTQVGTGRAGHENMLHTGDRVILSGHWGFEVGIVGTVANPPEAIVELSGEGEWTGCRRVSPGRNGPMTTYYIMFDEPHNDGSGDGPYAGAEIDEVSLKRLHELVKGE